MVLPFKTLIIYDLNLATLVFFTINSFVKLNLFFLSKIPRAVYCKHNRKISSN